MTICDRCKCKPPAFIMSKFNTDLICLDCKEDEESLPSYKIADAAELATVKAGNFNFRGVGLTKEDRTALKLLRGQRKRKDD